MPLFPGSNFVGGDWPNGFGLRFALQDDGLLVAQYTFDALKQGPSGVAHGGAIAAVLDEAMTAAAFELGAPAFTVNLEVSYRAIVPVDVPVQIIGRVMQHTGRKVFTGGQILLDDGTVAAEARGLFLQDKRAGR